MAKHVAEPVLRLSLVMHAQVLLSKGSVPYPQHDPADARENDQSAQEQTSISVQAQVDSGIDTLASVEGIAFIVYQCPFYMATSSTSDWLHRLRDLQFKLFIRLGYIMFHRFKILSTVQVVQAFYQSRCK
jgi:hypothetical protein